MKFKRPIRKSRRKIYYSTGMISLIMLPFLGFLFIQASPRFKKQHVVEINMFLKDHPLGLKLPTDLKSTDINLTGDHYWDSIKLVLALKTIRDYKLSHDTGSVIHFIFEDDAQYWTFVEVIDICRRERVMFVPHDEHIWVINKPRRRRSIEQNKGEEVFYWSCGTRYEESRKYVPPPGFWTSQKRFLKKNADVLWPASLILMLMIFVSLRRKKFTDPNK